MADIIEHFDVLTDLGLKVIPLRENSKAPLTRNWNLNWNREAARNKLAIYPNSNIGLLLGDIIDVEGDSVEANRYLESLIGNYAHPCYQSTRSVHHLFISPEKTLRHLKVNDIEFRGHGHQSVLPPSQHAGCVYRWLKRFEFPIPKMPDNLLNFYESKKFKRKGKRLKKDHVKTWCASCRVECMLHAKRFDLEIKSFKLLGSKWECNKCRTIDLRPTCRLIRSNL